jgi:hypothetical protein
MQATKWPYTTIGSCNNGAVLEARMYDIKRGGPFTNETDLNTFILDIPDTILQPMRHALLKHQRADHRIVFSLISR